MTTAVEDISLVDHACLIPESDEHLWEVTARWVAHGLAAGERVLYSEDHTADALLERLTDDRIDTDTALAGGQLSIIPTDTTRALLAMPLPQMETGLRQIIDDTATAGWPGLRLAGESGPGLLHACGLDKVIAYEHLVDRVLHTRPQARMLCRYDRRHFDDHAIAAMLQAHHSELRTPATYDDAVLRITRHGPGRLRLAGEIDRSNGLPLRRLLDTTLDQVLRDPTGPGAVTVDLSSLRFVDVAAAVTLVHVAEEFPATHRLVLTGVRPRIHRILDRCGAAFATQLDVLARHG